MDKPVLLFPSVHKTSSWAHDDLILIIFSSPWGHDEVLGRLGPLGFFTTIMLYNKGKSTVAWHIRICLNVYYWF